MSGASLNTTAFAGANLSRADLSGASLIGANLGANLRQAKLNGAVIVGAYLRGANLQGADLRGVRSFADQISDRDINTDLILYKMPAGELNALLQDVDLAALPTIAKRNGRRVVSRPRQRSR